MGLDCTVLYNPAVPVIGTHYEGSRLYSTVQPCIPVTGTHYDWSRLYSTVEPAVPVIGTHYNGSKLYSTVQPLTSKNFDWSIDCTIYMYCTTQQYL